MDGKSKENHAGANQVVAGESSKSKHHDHEAIEKL